jgi:hypothetical protein
MNPALQLLASFLFGWEDGLPIVLQRFGLFLAYWGGLISLTTGPEGKGSGFDIISMVKNEKKGLYKGRPVVRETAIGSSTSLLERSHSFF